MSYGIAIVGATGGIGSALARRLKADGHQVLLIGRTAASLNRLAGELDCPMAVADATEAEPLQQVLNSAGPLQGIVNCAGRILLKPAHLTSDREWSETLETNLTTAFDVVRGGVRVMMQSGGSIVLCSSAAATYAPRNIRVNCVAPGLVDTTLTAKIMGNEAALKASIGMHALGRVGKPEHIASAIAWLLDPGNDWVTGQVWGVDGGLANVRSVGK